MPVAKGFERYLAMQPQQPTGQQPQQQSQAPQDNGNFWSHLIPTAGGIGGAAGGAALGASLGSIVPGIGTVIGGLAGGVLGGAFGGGAGKVAENSVEGNKNLLQGVGQEALLSGAFSAPPLRLLRGLGSVGKVAIGGGKAIGSELAGQTAKQAFEKGFTSPGVLSKAGATLRGEARGVGIGDKVAGQGQLLPSEQAVMNKFLENNVKVKGLTAAKQLSSLEKYIADRNTQLTKAIDQSNRALTTTEKNAIAKNLGNTFKNDIYAATPRQQALLSDLATRIGQTKDIKSLDALRKGLDQQINFARNPNSAEPGMEQIFRMARKELTDAVSGRVVASKSLKSDLSNALKAQDLLLNKASGSGGFARASTSGNGMIPIPLRVTQSLQTLAGKGLGKLGGKEGMGFGIGATSARLGAGNALGAAANTIGSSPTLDQALMQQSGQPQDNSLFSQQISQSGQSPQSLFDQQISGQSGQTGQQQATQDPYPQANLLQDIQRDPKNADKYVAYYKSVQTALGGGSTAPKLNASQIQQANNANSALTDIRSIASMLQSDPNVILKDAVPGGSIARGITGTTDYQAAKQNVVDVLTRLRSGAAISANEEKLYKSLLPSLGDSPQSANNKLQRLQSLLLSFANPQAAQPDLTNALIQQQGGQ